MKRSFFLLVVLTLLCTLIACDVHKTNHGITLPKYEKEEYYADPDGFSEYVDHAKYHYTSESIAEFREHDRFREVTNEDVAVIRAHITDFTQILVDTCQRPGELTLQESQIKEGDFFCLIEKGDSSDARPLGDYALYYADMTDCLLYFFWLNV